MPSLLRAPIARCRVVHARTSSASTRYTIRISGSLSELEMLDLALRSAVHHHHCPMWPVPSQLPCRPIGVTTFVSFPLLPDTFSWRARRSCSVPCHLDIWLRIPLPTFSLFLQAFRLCRKNLERPRTRSGVELATVVDLIFPGRDGARRGEGGGDARWWEGGGSGHHHQQGMTTARQWWRRAAAAVKDQRSLYLTRVRPASGELEAAVIRATSHNERCVDYASAARVFALARASSSPPALMWALAQRAGRTRCWAVALKALVLAHGLLLRCDRLGRVPFDLADFRDRSSAKSPGLSAFVRAYFRFLDARSLFAAQEEQLDDDDDDSDVDEDARRLDHVAKLQHLLSLLMQIRPYGDGVEQRGLVLEAMDCVVIEVFEVYSRICTGIARFLVGVLGSAPITPRTRPGETVAAARRRRGAQGMRVLRKAAEQSAQLSSYFELCRGLGVLNAAEFPAVERVPDDDIRELEKLVTSHSAVVEEQDGGSKVEETTNSGKELVVVVENAAVVPSSKTVVTKEWVVFEADDDSAGTGGVRQGLGGNYGNPFVGAPWAAVPATGDLLLL